MYTWILVYIVDVFVPQYFRFVTVSDFRAFGITTTVAFKKTRITLHQMSNEQTQLFRKNRSFYNTVKWGL